MYNDMLLILFIGMRNAFGILNRFPPNIVVVINISLEI